MVVYNDCRYYDYIFLQHCGQHLLGSLPDVGFQNVLYLGPLSLAAITLTTVTLI